jgi:hypothetical protein
MAVRSTSRGLSSDEIIEILDDPADENVAIYDSGSENLSHTSQLLGRLHEIYFFVEDTSILGIS